MHLNQIASFLAVSKTLNFTGAARQLGVPQSTISRQINFIWQPDAVYWATDSGNLGKHFLFMATRDQTGIISPDSIQKLYRFYTFPPKPARFQY